MAPGEESISDEGHSGGDDAGRDQTGDRMGSKRSRGSVHEEVESEKIHRVGDATDNGELEYFQYLLLQHEVEHIARRLRT